MTIITSIKTCNLCSKLEALVKSCNLCSKLEALVKLCKGV